MCQTLEYGAGSAPGTSSKDHFPLLVACQEKELVIKLYETEAAFDPVLSAVVAMPCWMVAAARCTQLEQDARDALETQSADVGPLS